jgi:hypothetical protein
MKVLLSADADQARAIGRHTVLKFYLRFEQLRE